MDNSYNLSDEYNQIDWQRIKDNQSITNALREMLAVRKEYAFFRMNDAKKIKERIRFDRQSSLLRNNWKKEVSYKVNYHNESFQVIFKNDFEESAFYFAPGAKLIFNGLQRVDEEISSLVLTKPGAYIIKRN